MGGKSSKKKVTVGYRYYWDLFSGLGRGPINSIVAILADKKIVYIGKKDELSTNTSFFINKPNLFGGEDTGGEGGIQGTLDVFMGEQNQIPSDKLKNLLKGLVPGFRGIVTTLFSGLVSCYSASPKPWVYRVRRTNKGWDNNKVWYPEKCLILLRDDTAEITGINDEINARLPKKALETEKNALYREIETNIREIHAMNPAHILIECATNRDWGRGLSFDDIDLASFKQSADKLYDENLVYVFVIIDKIN
ncbi:hypothetical protein PT273_08885 [Orbaceae bacterium ESL0727]|nr:hypothetical protein [Orbaceae bacterium ESL0727]